MESCKLKATLLPPGYILSSQTDTPPVDIHRYYHIVGKLVFLTHTRPDIAYAIGIVNRYMSCP